MSFEKFTDKARKVLVLAQDEARSLHQPYVGTEHILLGLIQEKDGLAAQALDISSSVSSEFRRAYFFSNDSIVST